MVSFSQASSALLPAFFLLMATQPKLKIRLKVPPDSKVRGPAGAGVKVRLKARPWLFSDGAMAGH